MQRLSGERLYSATDLVAFLECEHLSALDLRALDDDAVARRTQIGPMNRSSSSRDKGDEHEKRHLQRTSGRRGERWWTSRRAAAASTTRWATLAAMREGVEVIYQATLRDGCWVGHADFLRRVDGVASSLGSWSYEVADTKLARSPRPSSWCSWPSTVTLLAKAQGRGAAADACRARRRTERNVPRAPTTCALPGVAAGRFLAALRACLPVRPAKRTYPVPASTATCATGASAARRSAWRTTTCPRWPTSPASKRPAAGRGRRHRWLALAALPGARQGSAPPAGHSGSCGPGRAARQARRTGEREVLEHLPLDPDGRRGFHRLPRRTPATCTSTWKAIHSRTAGWSTCSVCGSATARISGLSCPSGPTTGPRSGQAFESLSSTSSPGGASVPGAHVYHYASYEETALKRLASMARHPRSGGRQPVASGRPRGPVQGRARGNPRVSEPSYSIKYVEHFYRPARAGDVQNAGASIVFYERWRETQDAQLLQDIADYNRDDVESTQQLRDWLLTLRPAGLPWRELTVGSRRG
jgi:hypothetical protein